MHFHCVFRLLISILLLFHPADALPADPATVIPATPRYDLQCEDYNPPPPLIPGDPLTCQNLILHGIPLMITPPEYSFLFTDDPATAPQPFGPVPFSIDTRSFPLPPTSPASLYNDTAFIIALLDTNAISDTHSSLTERSTNGGYVNLCRITFRFRDGTPSGHEERVGTNLLVKDTIVAWGNCMVQGRERALEPVTPTKWARMDPKPLSQVRRLVMDVEAFAQWEEG